MMKRSSPRTTVLALTAALAAALGLAAARDYATIKKSGEIVIATEGAYAPFNYFDGKKLTGFEVDLANALAARMGLKPRWVTQKFDSLLIGLGQDRYDFVIASHGITPERQAQVDFTNPHYCSGGVIVAKTGGPKTAAALVGKTVAVQVGSTYLENVSKVPGIKQGDIKTFPQDTDALQNLLAGRTDAWVSDRFTAIEAKKTNPGLQIGDLLFSERIAMAVKKGNAGLVKALNDALAAVQKDGTYKKLSEKYFAQDIRCK